MVRKRIIPLLMAVMMVLSVGFIPSQQASAASKVNSATLPKEYKSGYTVYKCIDISNWQGVISTSSFKKLKSSYGITHVIVRVGYTSQAVFWRHADASYKENISNAYAAGLKVGAYYYSQAKSVKEAQKEADKTIKLLRNYKSKIKLPVAFDWEWGKRLNARWAKGNGKAANTKICEAYCEKIKAAGYTPMIYASASVIQNYTNQKTLHDKYKMWIAHYTFGKATGYDYPMYMWQFSSTARYGKNLTGTTNVDLNYLFVKKSGKWVKFSNGRYKYKQGGTYLTSQWLELKGKKYYFDEDGYRVTGYHKIGNYYYGFNSKGVMYKSKTVTIGGNKYKFLSNGRSVLYSARVVNVSDYLAYRTKPSLNKGSRAGKYKPGKLIYVVRTKGDWVMAGNGYWSLSVEDGTPYLQKETEYPQ